MLLCAVCEDMHDDFHIDIHALCFDQFNNSHKHDHTPIACAIPTTSSGGKIIRFTRRASGPERCSEPTCRSYGGTGDSAAASRASAVLPPPSTRRRSP